MMLTRGPSRESPAPDELELERGLALLPGVIIDQHFAERGRIGRLTAAVDSNPALLGVGIDEDTAILVDADESRVLGSGSVYLVQKDSAALRNYSLVKLENGDELSRVPLHSGRRKP
jgi:cyanophycinase